jgi:cobalt-zinc-cadmium efflux system outer membrane protein
MTVTLPFFSKGQELSAVGTARAARLRAELDAARTRVRVEVRSAFDAYSRRLAAVRVLETDAIPGLDENETLTTRSFEVGQLGLPELLLIRREILDTRSQYLDALLEAALARIDLDASAAILR